MKTPILPTIHLNGTHPTDLREQYLNAYRACIAASQALGKAQPNGRDYYPQGDTAAVNARNEHAIRIEKIVEIANEMMAVCQHCDQFCK